jgi:hypothetical protein
VGAAADLEQEWVAEVGSNPLQALTDFAPPLGHGGRHHGLSIAVLERLGFLSLVDQLTLQSPRRLTWAGAVPS